MLDVSPPALGGLTIDGKLTFSNNADLELTTEWIMVHGELAIGTEASPHTRKATITLTDNVKGEDVWGHGRPRHHALGRHPEPARRPEEHLDQARQHGQCRQHLDTGAECR